jgi:hypothetical protein
LRLITIDGETWPGEGMPFGIELAPDDKPRNVARRVPARILLAAHNDPWLSRGLAPPARSVNDLRRELEKRARAALTSRPRTQLRPLSEAAFELGVPERTLRSQIVRGVRGAQRNARGELALELPTSSAVVLRFDHLSRRPDPRVLMQMARDRVQPGQEYHPGYVRRGDGDCWREAW